MGGTFQLQLEPSEKLQFESSKLGEEPVSQSIKMTNLLKERVAFKVKCTSNPLFKIHQPIGALAGEEKVDVNVTFRAGKSIPKSGKHYFEIYYVKATDEKMNARQVWADHTGTPEGSKRMYVHFKKVEGSEPPAQEKEVEKEEDKKEEENKEDEKKEEEKKEVAEEKKEEKPEAEEQKE